MRALADFILRGRLQAAVVALIGNWVPLLTPATVALVTLRVGHYNGLLIMLWGLLPALVFLGLSQIAPLFPVLVAGSVVIAYGGALLLRRGAGWQGALMSAVALASLLALLHAWLAPETVEQARQALNGVMADLASDAEVSAPEYGRTFIVGMAAYGMVLPAILGLLLGRWWHAIVDNPGGFKAEFQALRLAPVPALLCLLASGYCLFRGPDYSIWSGVFALPLVFHGVALVHRLLGLTGRGVQWLVLFYAALVLLQPAPQVLAVFAFLDTWLNFRERAKPRA